MSDVVESAAPSSTADVAATVIADFESDAAEATVSESTETPAVEAPAAPSPPVETTPAIVEKPLSPAAEFLLKQGHKHTKVDGRRNWLPVSAIEPMLDRYVEQHKATWTGERGEIEKTRDQYRSDLEAFHADFRGDPKAMLEKMAQVDARYRAFLEPAAAPVPAAPASPMPDPDVTLPDGSRTFSIAGLQKLLDWNTANVEARLMPKFEERLKPLAERDQAERARAEQEKAQTALRTRTSQQIADAQQWPGFKDHEADILTALKADTGKTLTLEAAYRQVVLPKMSADRQKMRDELLKEINSTAGKTPTVPPGGGERPRNAGPMSTRDVAARTIAALEGV